MTMILDWLRNLRKTKEERAREAITAYLDGQLSAAERTQLEKELAQNSHLQAELEAQRQVKASLSQLPRLKAPRNFTLDPAVYGQRRPSFAFQIYPKLRLASAAMTVLLVAVVAVEWTVSSNFEPAAAPMASQAEQAEVAMAEAEPTLPPPALTEEPSLYAVTVTEETPVAEITEEVMAASEAGLADDTAAADESLPTVPAIPPNASGSAPAVGGEFSSGAAFQPPAEPEVEVMGESAVEIAENQEGDVAEEPADQESEAVEEPAAEAPVDAMPTPSLEAPRPEELATDTMRVMSETPESSPTELAYIAPVETPDTTANLVQQPAEEEEVARPDLLATARNLLTVAVALLVVTTVYFRSKLD